MSTSRAEREPVAETAIPAAAAPTAAPSVTHVLRLQASAGNQAVARALLARQAPPAAAAARTAQQLADLDEDITQAIAEKETGRKTSESNMRTSAGVRASFASQVQATAGWTISALRALDDVRLASFGITRAELNSADARAVAAGKLWDGVMASPAGTTAVAFATANAARVTASGLTQAELDRMFLFRELKADLEDKLATVVPVRTAALRAMSAAAVWGVATAKEQAAVGAKKVTQMTDPLRDKLAPVIARRETIDAVAAGTPATTLGIPAGTITAYRPVGGGANWAEDKAGWMRIAVGRDPGGGDVGTRLESAATADDGLRLGRAHIAHINEQYLQAHPGATDDQVCDNAAVQHNPHHPMKDVVRKHFHTFHAARAAAAPPAGATPAAPAPAGAAPAGAAPAAPAGAAPAGAAPAAPAGAAPAGPAAAPGPTGSIDGGAGDTRLADVDPGGEADGGTADADAGGGSSVADAGAAAGGPGPAPGGSGPAADIVRPAPLTEDQVLAQWGFEPVPERPEAERTLAAKRRVARVPSQPASPVPVPAGGAPTSATQDIATPTDPQARSRQGGGNQDAWFDDVVRSNLGVTVPAGVDPYDWLITTFVTVNVFGVTSGPILPRFATKLQRASARAEQMIRDRLTAAGQTVTGALTNAQWNIGSVSGWDAGRLRGSHAFGQATDIDYFENPYVAHEAGEAQTVDVQTGPAYDRAVILFGDGQRLLSVVPDGAVGRGADKINRPDRITNAGRPAAANANTEAGRTALYAQTMTVYNQLASDSNAMAAYFALVYPAPNLNSSTPTAATPHPIDTAAAQALLPRLQALPPAALDRAFDGHPPATLDAASVAAALHPIIVADYGRLGGNATNAGRNDKPFATRGDAAQRAQRDPRRGFMSLPFEVVFSLRAEGLRWGACDFAGVSGDIQHFDDGAAHVIPQRP